MSFDPRLTLPPDEMIPPPQPIPKDPVKSTLEILPGLVVEPRFINGNWYLIPVEAEHQLPDVEKMIIEDLATEIEAGELTMGDKCCLISALAERRRANIEALRNTMGLLATDKPIPLTEVPPWAAVQEGDQALNDLPTAAETGIQQFDFIEYNYTQFQDPEILGPFYTDDWTWVWTSVPHQHPHPPHMYYGTFKHGERVQIYLVDKVTGDRISVIADTILKHWQYEFPPNVWHGHPMFRITFTKPSVNDTFYNLWHKVGPYGVGAGIQHEGGFYQQFERDDPLPLPHGDPWNPECCIDVHPEGRLELNDIGMWVDAVYLTAPYPGSPQGWGYVTNQVGIVIERMDYSQYGIDLLTGYYNHPIADLVIESRRYEKNYPNQALLAEVAAEEIILLDDNRLNGLINAPQYALGKVRLEELKNTPLTW